MSASAHSKYGGSIASRWMNCAGSVALCETIPPLPATAAADEGTLAHDIAEKTLQRGLRTVPKDLRCDAAMEGHIQTYLNAVWAEYDAHDNAQLFVEQSFVLDVASALPGEVFGRNDAMVYSRAAKRLVVFDLKYGAGVIVEAEGNKQGLFYASGALLTHDDWPISEVEVVIVQPRSADASEDHGGVKRWTFPASEVLDFVSEVEAAVVRAKEVAASYADNKVREFHFEPFVEGAWCRWCAAGKTPGPDGLPICPVKWAAIHEGFGGVNLLDLDVKALPEPRKLDPVALGKLLNALAKLEPYAKSVEELAFAMALNGEQTPGWKLVEKMARRKWIDADDKVAGYIATTYGVPYNDVMPPKLVTITEAERLITAALGGAKNARAAKEDVSLKFTIKESSGLTLAPASDKREAVNPAAAFTGVSVPAQ